MSNVKGVCLKAVIAITVVKGSGTEKDPVRMVVQYWDLDGNFLFELEG